MTVNKALLGLQTKLAKQYGEGSVMFASDIPEYDVVSIGSLALDYAIGIGGVPTNRVIEIAGEEGAGKTSIAMMTIKNFLLRYPDRGALILDLEHRITTSWVESLVGKELMERIIVTWPDDAEQSTDIYTDALKTDAISIALYDSIGGSPSQRVTGKSATVGDIGGNALAMSRFAKFASIFSAKHSCLTVCINQVRDDMDGYHRLNTPGGRALKHAYSLRVELKKGKDKFMETINGEELQVGYSIRAKVHKNSLAAPYRVCTYNFYNVPCSRGFGVDTLDEIIRLGILTGIFEVRGGGWHYHQALPGGKIQTVPKLVEAIRDDKSLEATLVSEIMAKLSDGGVKGVAETFDPDLPDNENGSSLFTTDLMRNS